MTSTAPTPGRPARPCTAELLAAAELPATTAGTAVTSPKIPAYVGDGTPALALDVPASAGAGEPSPAGTVELLIAAAHRATSAVPAAAEPKLPPFRGD
jgi:hypothetical protein